MGCGASRSPPASKVIIEGAPIGKDSGADQGGNTDQEGEAERGDAHNGTFLLYDLTSDQEGGEDGTTRIEQERRSSIQRERRSSLRGIPEDDLEALQRAEGINASVLSLADAFDQFDRDRSGGIDVKELQVALSFLGLDSSSEQALAILEAYDSYPDQVMDIKEFTALVRDILFLKRFDANADGFLDVDELHKALCSIGLEVDKSMAAEIMRHFDIDGNGAIDLAELSILIKTAIAFVRYDVDQSGTIDEDELREAMRKLGLRVGALAATSLFRRYKRFGF